MLVALVMVAALVLGTDFTWTGGGANDDWDNCANWGTCPSGGYPDDVGDRAIFPWDSGQDWTVKLIPEIIDELEIKDNVDFTSDDATVTFAAKLTIDAADGDIVVTIGNDTIIDVP